MRGSVIAIPVVERKPGADTVVRTGGLKQQGPMRESLARCRSTPVTLMNCGSYVEADRSAE